MLGNKCDLEDKRVVSRECGESLASSLDAKFFEVSALTAENAEKVIELISFSSDPNTR